MTNVSPHLAILPLAATAMFLVLAVGLKAPMPRPLRLTCLGMAAFLFALPLGPSVYCWGKVGRFLLMIPAFGYVVLLRQDSEPRRWLRQWGEVGAIGLGLAVAMHPTPKCIGDPYWFFCIPPFVFNLLQVLASGTLGLVIAGLLRTLRRA